MAKKSVGPMAAIVPQVVLIVGTFDEAGNPDAMNVAWGGQCGPSHVALNLSPHKTTDNILANKEFTVAICDLANMVPGDYVGIVSGNKEPEKIAKSGWTYTKGEIVNAPVFDQLPITMECKLVSANEELGETRIVGEVVNTFIDEAVLGDDGKIDGAKLNAISFYGPDAGYYVVNQKVGQAWREGQALK